MIQAVSRLIASSRTGRYLGWSGLALALFFFAARLAPIAAHTFHKSFAEINHNTRSNSLEITIQLHADDLVELLTELSGKPVALEGNKAAESLVALFIRSNFQFQDQNGRLVGLEWVGMELERHFVNAYLEVPLKGAVPSKVRNRLFCERFPDQFNQILLRRDQQYLKKQLIFFSSDPPGAEWKSLDW